MGRLLLNKQQQLSGFKPYADNEIKVAQKFKFVFKKGRKHCMKRRKCWLPAFSPFPTIFSTALCSKDVKSRDFE